MEDNILIIEIKNGPEDGKVYKFKENDFPIIIGRDIFGDEKEIPIVYDTFVSKKHVEVKYIDNQFVLKDLNSSNGTKINDSPIEKGEEKLITDKTIITVGYTNLLIRLPASDLSKSVQALMKSRVM